VRCAKIDCNAVACTNGPDRWYFGAYYREANIGHLRTREGMAKARRRGKLRGKQPKLPPSAARAIRRRYAGCREGCCHQPQTSTFPLVESFCLVE
jgi:hypothetical protein